MNNIRYFKVYGFNEDETGRLQKIKEKLSKAVGKDEPVEAESELLARLRNGLTQEELRDLLAMRKKFTEQYLRILPEDGVGVAEDMFYENFGIAKIEEQYTDAQTNAKTYRYADGKGMEAKKLAMIREKNRLGISDPRMLQLSSILRASGMLGNERDANEYSYLQAVERMIKTQFLTSDEAVKAFIENFPKINREDKDREFNLELVMDFAKFFGNDPKKIIFFFEMIRPKGAIKALKIINDRMREMLDDDLHHLARWVDAISSNEEEQNTRANCFLRYTNGLSENHGQKTANLLPSYQERCKLLNTLLFDIPAIEGLEAYVSDEHLEDAKKTWGATGERQRAQSLANDRNKYEYAYSTQAYHMSSLAHIFIEDGKFNKEAFLKLFNLLTEIKVKDLELSLSGNDRPGSVAELEKRVNELRMKNEATR